MIQNDSNESVSIMILFINLLQTRQQVANNKAQQTYEPDIVKKHYLGLAPIIQHVTNVLMLHHY